MTNPFIILPQLSIMMLLVHILPLVALCAGKTIPSIPGDNSDGDDRYFWIPDGNEEPQLVDSEEPVDFRYLATRNGSDNQYWLYTRNNPTTAQILVHGDINSVSSSNYVATKPIMVICHGWRNSGKANVNKLVTNAALAAGDINVIVLDWNKLAGKLNYYTAAAGVPEVGRYLGNFLIWLINNAGGNWNNVHIVGHSLGAHVAGNAGRQTGGLPARITGLDPAGHAWEDNADKLTNTDAVYVEAIHTDGARLGLNEAVGDADFYPNGGRNPQPGCLLYTCSHSRAYQLFASTIENNGLVGKQCSSVKDANKGKNCNGPSLNMGNNILTKRGSGIYYLTTVKSYPY